LLAHWRLTRLHQPQLFWDSGAYTEEARQAFSLDQFFYPKPIFVSVVMRVIGTDPGRIVTFQQWLSVVSWLVFAAAIVSSLQTTRARIVALVGVAIVALDPFRLGYSAAVLSESINDSILALLAAGVLLLCSRELIRARTAMLAATTAVAACWMLTRDTNAVITLVAIPVGLLLWRPSPRRYVRELVALGFAVAVAVFVLWSTSVSPGVTHLTFQGDWPEEFRARMTYSMMNNIVDRVLPDPDAREFFIAHGLPEASTKVVPDQREQIIVDPALAAVRHWIAKDARRVWMIWLLSTPGTRIRDQWEHGWQMLGAADDEHVLYMPKHWRNRGMSSAFRRLLSNHTLLALLLLALPGLMYFGRRHRLTSLVPAMIAGGWLASMASLYGDSAEIGRHCYGSGQVVVLGLLLALLLCVDSSRRTAVS